MPREHVRQVGQRDPPGPFPAHRIRSNEEIEPEPIGQCGEAIGDERRLHVRVAAFLAELRADEAHHVIVRPVPLRANPAVGRPEPPLAPEGEPDCKLVPRADRAAKIEFHHRKQPLDRGNFANGRRFLAGRAVFVGKVAKRLREEAVLAPEMQVDDALAESRLLGDRRDRGIGEAAVGDAADRGLDQLFAALFRGRRTALGDHRELAFRIHKKPC